MKNFDYIEKLLGPVIFTRALDYYQNDRIVELQEVYPGEFYALVKGSGSNSYYVGSINSGAAWTVGPILIDANGGNYNSIISNGSDVYISYYDTAANNLMLGSSTDTGANWGTSVIIDNTIVLVGDYSSLTMDYAGQLQVSYFDQTNNRLRHGFYNGSWNLADAEDFATVGQYTSIVTYNEIVYILYYDFLGDDLVLTKSVDGGASW